MSRSGLEFKMLGPLEATVDGKSLQIRGVRQRAVLARLLLAQGRVVSVDSLVREVWDGRPPNTARTQVSICVAALRKLFRNAGCTDEVIATVQPGYQLCLSGKHLDTQEFAREVERGYGLGQEGHLVEAAKALKQALALWRGPALSDVPAQFAEAAATRLSEQRLLATEQLMTLRLKLGEHRSIIGDLSALLHTHPLREQLRATLMQAQYRAGQRAEALRTFREGRTLSIDELGLEPGAELQALHDAILKDTSVSPAVEEGPCVEWEQHSRPSELPLSVGEIVGRRDELRTLDALLSVEHGRRRTTVCFISGSPGTGKTALAVHWGRANAEHFPDGHLYVDIRETLAGSPGYKALSVLQRFLRSLGVHPDHVPRDLGECSAAYRSMLADRRALVVIDNATAFQEVEPLLPGGGQCCVLVTGLEPFMHSRGAAGLRLGQIEHADAIALLAAVTGRERIAAEPDAVDRLLELCARLPLAIRAAGVKLGSKPHWNVEDLVDRLIDPRRRLDALGYGESSPRACFDRALRHLPSGTTAAYRALSATSGNDFDVGAAAEVLYMNPSDAEDTLERLVDLNLLEVRRRVHGGGLSYRYPHLLRLHAEQLLAEDSLEQATLRLTQRTDSGRRPCPSRLSANCF
ncbi:BTAD domain-containing putative transcriptional regulator [Streptomyces sp. NPDC051662]|uniref:AfsR/SARP family transcriptional regulator n=1 Tax=Streptomyces sp. NPDC051662 TaxID=3154750 RepID=UPI00342DD1F1